MTVRGGEQTNHCATTAAVDVTYWATEFERVFITPAARIRGAQKIIRNTLTGYINNQRSTT